MIKEFASKDKSKIVFFGDSVTEGYFESGKSMHTEPDKDAVYHNKLKRLINFFFPEKEIEIINSGVGGQNATLALARLDKDVLEKDPDLVVVCFGLNDVNKDLSMFQDSLDKIFKAVTERSIPCVYMTPNMLNTRVTLSGLQEIAERTANHQTSGRMDTFIESAIEVAQKNGVIVCDCYKKWKSLHNSEIDINRLLANGINHPKREMHWLFAEALFETIYLN